VYYYPETAYWCTFDIDIPLFLPVYLYNRWKDTVLIAEAGADGQVDFTSGHEWGFWMQDWALARFDWDHTLDWTDALVEMAEPFGPAGGELGQLLTDLIAYQHDTLVDRGLIAYIAGEDTPDELGWLVGVLTHPKPVTFKELYQMDSEQLLGFENQILPYIDEMAQKYEDWALQLEALRPETPEEALPWLEELIDSVWINAYRSRHTYELYAGVVQIRGAELAVPGYTEDSGYIHFAEAISTKWLAANLIRAREAEYRYPWEWSSGWDEPGNVTSYPFRYMWTVHHVYFYTRREVQAMERNFDPFLHNIHNLLQEIF